MILMELQCCFPCIISLFLCKPELAYKIEWKRNPEEVKDVLSQHLYPLAIELKSFYLKEKHEKQGEGKSKPEFSSVASFPKCLQHLGFDQAEAKSLELSPGLPHRCQGLNYFIHHHLPPRVCIYRKLDLEAELRHFIMGWEFPERHRNCGAKYLPQQWNLMLLVLQQAGKAVPGELSATNEHLSL